MNESEKSPTFEQALAQLETIVRNLEDGNIGLEEALAQYEQGISLLRKCYEQLQRAEKRIVEHTGTDDEGQPVTRPFRHSATVDKKERDLF